MGLGDDCDCDSTSDLHLRLRLPQPLTVPPPPPCRNSGCNPWPRTLTFARSCSPSGRITTTTTTTASSSFGCVGVAVATDLTSPRATGPFLSCPVCPCTSISPSPPQNSALSHDRRRLLSPASSRKFIINQSRRRHRFDYHHHSLLVELLQASRHSISVEAVSTAPSPAQRLHTVPRDPTDQLNSPP